MALPVASPWFRVRDVPEAAGIQRIDEPHVHDFLRANIWHVRGWERDLVVDAGMGIGSLQTEVPALFDMDPVLVLTHAHLDHIGGAAEFDDVRMHPAERSRVAASLRGDVLRTLLGTAEPLPEVLIDALPRPGYDLDGYAVQSVHAGSLRDGQWIELEERGFEVLHTPGHTPGGICLFDPDDGTLFTGDTLYDDGLLDDLPESDPEAYRDSLRRLRELDVDLVLPGHGDPFDGDRMRMLIDRYLEQ